MKRALAATISNMRVMIENIKQNSLQFENKAEALRSVSDEMTSSSQNVASTIQDVAKGTSGQAEDLAGITVVLNDFGNKIEEITASIEDVDSKANRIDELAKGSNDMMNELVKSIDSVGNSSRDFTEKMKALGNSVNKINEITVIINGIADQTNLLALNASIESARAGEAGRGFAVVAEEIRKLAEQSKWSSNDIAKLLNDITVEVKAMTGTSDNMVREVKEQVKVLDSTDKAFKGILEAVGNISPTIEAVNIATMEINKGKDAILEKIEATSSIAEEVSASSEEISASAEEMNASSEEVASTALELTDMTKDMLNAVNKFKL